MIEIVTIVLTCTSGAILGLIFFGGLLWTVRRGLSSNHPALWFSASLILRVSIVLAGFYLISNYHSEGLLSGLAGFVLAQLLTIVLTRPSAVSAACPVKETSNASFS